MTHFKDQIFPAMCHVEKFLNVKHDNATKSMQVKDYSPKVLRFQQIADAGFLISK